MPHFNKNCRRDKTFAWSSEKQRNYNFTSIDRRLQLFLSMSNALYTTFHTPNMVDL